MNVSPAAIEMPCKPLVGESSSGGHSSVYMQKKDSRDLPALIVMLLTSFLSQGHQWIVQHNMHFEGCVCGVCWFGLFFPMYFISLDLEMWRSRISRQAKRYAPRAQGQKAFPSALCPAAMSWAPNWDAKVRCLHQDPFLTLLWQRKSSFWALTHIWWYLSSFPNRCTGMLKQPRTLVNQTQRLATPKLLCLSRQIGTIPLGWSPQPWGLQIGNISLLFQGRDRYSASREMANC